MTLDEAGWIKRFYIKVGYRQTVGVMKHERRRHDCGGRLAPIEDKHPKPLVL
jgi:hypothetical protein